MTGFAIMSIMCTPAFYYNYRNLKDGLILGLFLFVMALLDTVLPPWKNRLRPMGTKKTALAWFAVVILLYALSTLRLYVVAMIVTAIMMHTIATSSLSLKQRTSLLVILLLIVVLGFISPFVGNTTEMYEKSIRPQSLTPMTIIQGLFSPLPWGDIVREEPSNVVFYSLYWLFLPYALYAMFRHLRKNINWHLFLYVMVTYVIGTVIANPARKRLILYPILVTWILANLAYWRWVRAGQPEYGDETEVEPTLQP
jgi:hypothetical protein